MLINWRPDVPLAQGTATLNVDALGSVPVKLANGISGPSSADILAGRLYPLWYDGSVFRMIHGELITADAAGSRPLCTAAMASHFFQTLGGAGVKDEMAICAKDAADQYGWRVIY
jgi:hypothetical protein